VSAAVELGCGIAGMGALQPGSVDLLLSDLPSGETQVAFDVRPDLGAFWEASWRALAPAGVAVVFASSLRFASELQASSKHFRYDIVWHKTLATGHLNARRRPLRAHEFILVFFRDTASVYNAQMSHGHGPIHQAHPTSHSANYGKFTRATDSRAGATDSRAGATDSRAGATDSRAGATDRYPVSVLRFSCVGTSSKHRTHPQQKPEPLLQWLTRTYSNPGALIVDPFAGSGSGGRAAAAEGRRWLGWDTDPRFATGATPPMTVKETRE
jgi:hypothetical protein